MLDTLIGGMYPPDYLVNLATKIYGKTAPDSRWDYVTGTMPHVYTFRKPCYCERSKGGYSDEVPSPYPPGIKMDPVVNMTRHFHASQAVFFLGKCDFCNTIYWSCPSIKKGDEDVPLV